jgi:hypothetical protein
MFYICLYIGAGCLFVYNTPLTFLDIRSIYLPTYLSIHLWLYSHLLGLGRFFSFLILFALDRATTVIGSIRTTVFKAKLRYGIHVRKDWTEGDVMV